MTLLSILLSVGLAFAGAPEDLQAASDGALPTAARMQAFERLVMRGNTDLVLVLTVAADEEADARQRWVAVRVLGQVGGDRASETLLGLLDNDMPAMRAAATQALGDVGNKRHTARVGAMLEDDAVIVRAASAEALGKLADPSAVPALTAQLDSKDGFYRGSSLWVRKHYVVALGQIRSKKAVPSLLRSLDDADTAVASATVQAFEEISGFSYAEGRNEQEQREAWRRWAQSQL